MKSVVFVRVIAVALVIAACEVVARAGLWIINPRIQQDWRFQAMDYEALLTSKRQMVEDLLADDNSGYITVDAELGWSINPDRRHSEVHDGVRKELYQSNSHGFRSTREYDYRAASDVVRIAVFGDSFSHADDVHNDFAWSAIWENASPGLEVLNFGVPGYGTDQAYLRYLKDGSKFQPDIAILGIMSENINRNLNTFIPFYRYDSWPNSKPRFNLTKEGSLELYENTFREPADYQVLLDDLPSALEAQGKNDWWYNAKFQPGILDHSALFRIVHYAYTLARYPWLLDKHGIYNRRSEHYRVLLAIVENFSAEARRNGAIPVIVTFPSLEVLTEHRQTGKFMYSPLLEDLDERGIEYVDVLQGFRKYGDDIYDFDLVPKHYSIAGNQIAARYLQEEFDSLVEQVLSARSGR